MVRPQAEAGICRTCTHRDNCSLTERKEVGAFQCSEYEAARIDDLVEGSCAPTGEADTGSAPVLGLCMDCAGREKCTFNKPEGGVWHCEEYATE